MRIAVSYFYSAFSRASPSATWRISSSTALAASSTSPSSRTTPKRSGVFPATDQSRMGCTAHQGAVGQKGAMARRAKVPFSGTDGVKQKDSQTSLIERFLYPKFGPGQMWQEVAERVTAGGGEIRFARVTGMALEGGRVVSVSGVNQHRRSVFAFPATMCSPPCLCATSRGPDARPPQEVRRVARVAVPGLSHGRSAGQENEASSQAQSAPQPPAARQLDLHSGKGCPPRAPAGVQQLESLPGQGPVTIWLGLEYFCNEGDDLWQMADDDDSLRRRRTRRDRPDRCRRRGGWSWW